MSLSVFAHALSFAGNSFGPDGARVISSALERNSTLISLNIGREPTRCAHKGSSRFTLPPFTAISSIDEIDLSSTLDAETRIEPDESYFIRPALRSSELFDIGAPVTIDTIANQFTWLRSSGEIFTVSHFIQANKIKQDTRKGKPMKLDEFYKSRATR